MGREPEEPNALIGHVRICGSPGGAIPRGHPTCTRQSLVWTGEEAHPLLGRSAALYMPRFGPSLPECGDGQRCTRIQTPIASDRLAQGSTVTRVSELELR
jgi:hypothetical protein